MTYYTTILMFNIIYSYLFSWYDLVFTRVNGIVVYKNKNKIKKKPRIEPYELLTRSVQYPIFTNPIFTNLTHSHSYIYSLFFI